MIEALGANPFSLGSNALIARAFASGTSRNIAGIGGRRDVDATKPEQRDGESDLSARSLVVEDRAELSAASQNGPAGEGSGGDSARGQSDHRFAQDGTQHNDDGDSYSPSSGQLSSEDEQQVRELQKKDAEVRRHEQAHMSAGGGLTGGAQYEYTRGPDGKQYARSGHVRIDTAPVEGDPQATAQKARRIRAAALAPANPSSADRAAAAKADRMESQARAELQKSEQPVAANESASNGRAHSMPTAGSAQGPTPESGSTVLKLERESGIGYRLDLVA